MHQKEFIASLIALGIKRKYDQKYLDSQEEYQNRKLDYDKKLTRIIEEQGYAPSPPSAPRPTYENKITLGYEIIITIENGRTFLASDLEIMGLVVLIQHPKEKFQEEVGRLNSKMVTKIAIPYSNIVHVMSGE